jgi:hypothetical protein
MSIETRPIVRAAAIVAAQSPFVRIRPAGVSALARRAHGQTPPDRDQHVPPGVSDPGEAFLLFCLNAMLDGGYLHADGRTWAEDGSGAKALTTWLRALLRALGPLTAWNAQDTALQETVSQAVHGLPFATERRFALLAFARGDRRERLAAIARQAVAQGRIQMRHATEIAAILPEGFHGGPGGDPFLKKACLALQNLADWAARHGIPVACETIVPADRDLHRALIDFGVLDLSADGHAALSGPLLRGCHPFVREVRSACIAACAAAAHEAGGTDAAIGAALFRILREDAGVAARAVPALPALTFWF